MLVLNRSLLNKEYTITNVLKALASIISTCSHYIILISKITPRYFISIDEGDVPSLQCKMSLNWSNSVREIDGLNIIFMNFIFQWSHHISITLRPCCSFLRTYPSLQSVAYIYIYIYMGVIHRDLDVHQVFGGYHLYCYMYTHC
jgi:hypothetical protein